jgi:chromosome segregation ATPase
MSAPASPQAPAAEPSQAAPAPSIVVTPPAPAPAASPALGDFAAQLEALTKSNAELVAKLAAAEEQRAAAEAQRVATARALVEQQVVAELAKTGASPHAIKGALADVREDLHDEAKRPAALAKVQQLLAADRVATTSNAPAIRPSTPRGFFANGGL